MRHGRIDVVLITDRRIARVSGEYRGNPHATDVLAFAYGDPDLAGEVLISLDSAWRQAGARGVSIDKELVLLCVHGLLHIRGQGDESYRDWCGMRRMEFETLMRIL